MFQDFAVQSSPETVAPRVEALRRTFDDMGIDAFIVPRADAYQGEHVPASEARLAWISGFTGSAGAAIVARDNAFIFVDGRYTTQVRMQTDTNVFQPLDLIQMPPSEWVKRNAAKGMRIGFDPWLHTIADAERLKKAAETAGARLVALATNPIDRVWDERPEKPCGPIAIHPVSYAGKPAAEKIVTVQEAVGRAKADVFIMTDPSSIAWTFNIRGADVPQTPHPLARAVIPAHAKPRLFVEAAKLGPAERDYLDALCEIDEPGRFEAALRAIGKAGQTVMLDPALTPDIIKTQIMADGGVAGTIEESDPARLPRAVKNDTELEGARLAHRVDGAAMVSFLAWLDQQPPGAVDEIAAARKLEALRIDNGDKQDMPLKDIGFETISGSGPNGAIIHYRVNENTNRPLQSGDLFLVDSGGQYLAGTTDITRTVAIGTPSEEMRRFFTLVLKGMIAISIARFPEGTRGVELDPLARIALWKAGADFGHGTGHGVGSYLGVHEGPQTISRRGMQTLLPGMILSNEPGYYREGAFGIRIENLVAVHDAQPIDGGDKPMLGFETLTLCPIDSRLVDTALMGAEEIDWLNAYHARVAAEITPLLSDDGTKDWLEKACRPI